jgi:hypothetical protein
MPLFGQKDPVEEEAARARQQAAAQAARARQQATFEWAYGAPAADLAAELMRAFGGGGAQGSDGVRVSLDGLFRWLGFSL